MEDITVVSGEMALPSSFWLSFGSDKTSFNVRNTMVTTDESSDELNACEGK